VKILGNNNWKQTFEITYNNQWKVSHCSYQRDMNEGYLRGLSDLFSDVYTSYEKFGISISANYQ
jgi:hypothetical protein